MQIIIYDTEFTAWPGSAQRRWSESWEFKEIIQFSALKVQITPVKLQLLESYNRFVTPKINPLLSEYIRDLTKIQQPEIDSGISNQQLFRDLEQLSQHGQIPMFSWGNDLHVLQETAQLNAISIEHLQSHDLRPLFSEFQIPTDYSSGQLYRHFKLPLQITEHNAEHDTISLLESMKCLQQQSGERFIDFFQTLLQP